MRPQQRRVLLALEGRPAGEGFVDDARQAVEIAPAVHRPAGDLFRRHVVERADELPVRGEPGQRQRLLRQPEVREVDVLGVVAVGARGDQDVAGLDVAVHEIVVMGGVERRCHLGGDTQGGRDRQWALAVQQGAQVQAGDVAHGDVEDAVGLAGFEDGHDVRVVDRGGHPRFVCETAPEGLVTGALGGDQLERDGTVEAQVLRAVDDGHATAADHALHPVAGDLLADEARGAARVHAEVRHLAHRTSPSPGRVTPPDAAGRSSIPGSLSTAPPARAVDRDGRDGHAGARARAR